MAASSDITLYTAQTPNGNKISIMLEELGIPYKVHKVDMTKNEQKTESFLAINPNGRIPALTDTFTDGSKIRLFESGSIMQYIVDRYDTDHQISFPAGSREHYEMTSWLFFLNAGVGPMQGQSNHFTRYAPEKIPYGIDRYQNETKRLYGVLDRHLSEGDKEWLVGGKCTIADIAHWGWITLSLWAGVSLSHFPALQAWEQRMWARPAVQRGASVPDPYKFKEVLSDPEKMKELEEKGRKVVQMGMKDDAEKNKAREGGKI